MVVSRLVCIVCVFAACCLMPTSAPSDEVLATKPVPVLAPQVVEDAGAVLPSPVLQELPPARAPQSVRKTTESVRVALKDGSQLAGELVEVEAVRMSTAFGQITVPVELIATIDRATSPQTRIVLRNGDRLTGDVDLQAIGLKTSWGEAEIRMEHVLSLLCAGARRFPGPPLPYSPAASPAVYSPSYPATAPGPRGPVGRYATPAPAFAPAPAAPTTVAPSTPPTKPSYRKAQ